MATSLTGKQSRHLRALAHSLKPVVQIGKNALGDGVQEQIEAQILSHELIKVRIGSECPVDARTIATELEATLGTQTAQIIGKTLVLYRRHPQKPKIELPKGR
ncbi:MAG: ribosome assembly RNA-binding protein YhbY [Polyangiaceae bacterium]|nr:ribosome assembly RNA-binding protein YhbY [Polyangiaceae bacterium]